MDRIKFSDRIAKLASTLSFIYVITTIFAFFPFFLSAQGGIGTNLQDKVSINWIIPPFLEAHEIVEFNSIKKRVVFETKKTGFISSSTRNGMADLKGQILLSPEYDKIEDRDSIVYLFKNFKSCYVKDLSSMICVTLPYPWVEKSYVNTYRSESKKSGLRFIQNGKGQYRIETLSGKFVTILRADQPPRFNEKYILYSQNGKMGMLDKNGKEKIPLKYGLISDFSNGHSALAYLEQNDPGVLIDTLGNVIFEPKDSMTLSSWGENSSSFLLQKKNSELKGIIDAKGKIIAKPFARFIQLHNGLYAHSKDLNQKWYVNTLSTQQPLLDGRGFSNIDFFKDTIITIDSEKNLVEVFTAESKKILEIKTGPWAAFHAYITQHGNHRFVRIAGFSAQKYYYLDGRSVFDEGSIKELTEMGFIIQAGEKFGLIDFTGKTLIPLVLDGLTYLDEVDSKSLWGKLDGKWGMLASEVK